jgi:hypothetical protein
MRLGLFLENVFVSNGMSAVVNEFEMVVDEAYEWE